ncbi:MAG TPA: hypothetical protein DCX65_02735, partial [Spirochaetaceae bacterium]|nr:hypothetical protein [Spirochaetaceae bacterium]
MKHIRYLLVLLAVAALVPAYGQSADLIAAANAAYQAESFERAFAIIADGLPETSTNTALKRQAAEALATIGVAEYGIRNFRNAYEAFRKALKYDPSNTTATQNFLRMRRELDVNNLRNEAGPRVVAAPVTAPTTEPAAATGAAAGSTATGTAPAAVPAGTATTTEPPAAGVAASVPVATAAVDLSELKTALEQADARLLSMESSVTSTNQENAQLRAAAEQQLRLLESLIAAQASTQASAQAATQAAAQAAAQAASRPTAAPAAAAVPVQSAAERELIAQTMALLAAMSEREAVAPQVVVQSDPELVNLMARLDEQGQVRQSQQNFNVILLIVVLVLGGGLIVFFLIFFLLVLRARKRSAGNRQAGYEGDHPQFPGPQSAGYLSAGQPAGETRLLEFIGSTSTAVGRPVDFDVRKDLLKA